MFVNNLSNSAHPLQTANSLPVVMIENCNITVSDCPAITFGVSDVCSDSSSSQFSNNVIQQPAVYGTEQKFSVAGTSQYSVSNDVLQQQTAPPKYSPFHQQSLTSAMQMTSSANLIYSNPSSSTSFHLSSVLGMDNSASTSSTSTTNAHPPTSYHGSSMVSEKNPVANYGSTGEQQASKCGTSRTDFEKEFFDYFDDLKDLINAKRSLESIVSVEAVPVLQSRLNEQHLNTTNGPVPQGRRSKRRKTITIVDLTADETENSYESGNAEAGSSATITGSSNTRTVPNTLGSDQSIRSGNTVVPAMQSVENITQNSTLNTSSTPVKERGLYIKNSELGIPCARGHINWFREVNPSQTMTSTQLQNNTVQIPLSNYKPGCWTSSGMSNSMYLPTTSPGLQSSQISTTSIANSLEEGTTSQQTFDENNASSSASTSHVNIGRNRPSFEIPFRHRTNALSINPSLLGSQSKRKSSLIPSDDRYFSRYLPDAPAYSPSSSTYSPSYHFPRLYNGSTGGTISDTKSSSYLHRSIQSLLSNKNLRPNDPNVHNSSPTLSDNNGFSLSVSTSPTDSNNSTYKRRCLLSSYSNIVPNINDSNLHTNSQSLSDTNLHNLSPLLGNSNVSVPSAGTSTSGIGGSVYHHYQPNFSTTNSDGTNSHPYQFSRDFTTASSLPSTRGMYPSDAGTTLSTSSGNTNTSSLFRQNFTTSALINNLTPQNNSTALQLPSANISQNLLTSNTNRTNVIPPTAVQTNQNFSNYTNRGSIKNDTGQDTSALTSVNNVSNPSLMKNDSDDDGDCVVCLERCASMVLYRCGHACLCEQCVVKVQQEGSRCPICRNIFIDAIKLYKI